MKKSFGIAIAAPFAILLIYLWGRLFLDVFKLFLGIFKGPVRITYGILGLFLAYSWTGYDMFLYHRDSAPMDRPAYVRGSFFLKAVALSVWPYTCRRNGELSWFSCCFLNSLIVITASLFLLTIWVSPSWAVLIISIIRTVRIPIIGALYVGIMSAICTILWAIGSKAFRLKIPGSMVRYYEEIAHRKGVDNFPFAGRR